MNDSLGVGGIQRIRDFDGDIEQLIHFQRTPIDQVLQGGPVEKLHGYEGSTVLFANVVDCANAGMIQRGGGLSFSLKATQSLLVAGNFFREKLQRYETPQSGVFGLVNHSHATATEAFDDAVM
jgi:hypothetical protein